MATKPDTKSAKSRPVRMQVRLTEQQSAHIDAIAAKSYRTPQQVVQMLFDQALLSDAYNDAAGDPTPLRSE